MNKNVGSLVCLLFAACAVSPARSQSAVYVNLSPDLRYSTNGHDSRVAFDLEKGLYRYGHDLGRLVPCAADSKSCVAFDFMALYDLPDDAAVGKEFVEGDLKFSVVRTVDLAILGSQREVLRVEVEKSGKRSNAYLVDPKLGVVAIIIPNFGSKEIPESIFLLRDRAGVFAKTNGGVEEPGTGNGLRKPGAK